MSFNIRSGEAKDMPSVFNLIKELAKYEKEPEAVKIEVEDLVAHGCNEHPAFYTFVAEQEGVIIGTAIFYNRFSTWDGPSLHLEDLIVTKSHRGKGVGKALYDAVLNVALEKGISRVEWVVLDWNSPAIEFYKNTGANMYTDWNICQMTNQQIANYLSKK